MNLLAGVTLGAIGLIMLFIFGVIIGGFFMWIAAKIAHVKGATFGKAVVAAIATSFVTVVIAVISRALPIIGDVLGFIMGLIVSIVIIKGVFDTSFGKAIVVWIFQLIAIVIALFLASALLALAIL